MGDAPVKKFRIGFIEAAVWNNDKFHSVTLSRTYKDGEDYKTTDSLGQGDLLNAAQVLTRAEAYIAENQ